ncbi:TetR/AcrR family transcriptional regulator [bacterium]|nr:TetR/AcrR family transcriptional regulator [bacterium]
MTNARDKMVSIDSSRDDVRDAIFQSAIELFARRGYYATTIRDIVEKAGVTQPMVYYYFGSKEKLFISCVRELFKKIVKTYENIDTNISFANYLKAFLDVGNDIYADSPESVLLMVNYIHSPEEYPKFKNIKNLAWKPVQMLIDVIGDAKDDGIVRKDIDQITTAIMVFGASTMGKSLHYINKNIADIGFDEEPKYFSGQIQKIILGGILNN